MKGGVRKRLDNKLQLIPQSFKQQQINTDDDTESRWSHWAHGADLNLPVCQHEDTRITS